MKRWWQSKTILAGIYACAVTLFQIWAVWVPVTDPPGVETRLAVAAPSEARVGATFAALTALGGIVWGRKTATKDIGRPS